MDNVPAPVAPVSPTSPTPVAAHDGGKKKLRMVLALLIGGLVVIGFAVFLNSFAGVSKADYKASADVAEGMTSAYSKMTSVYIGSSSTKTEIKNELSTIEDSRKVFDEKYDELAKTKAIKKDPDLKKLFSDVEKQKTKFDSALDAMVEAYSKILPVVSEVNDVTGSSSDAMAKLDQLQKSFESISGLKDQNNKDFVTKMNGLLTKYQTLAQKVQEGRADYTKYDSQASSDFYDTASDISKATRDWQSNLSKMGDDGEIADQINALTREINTKQFGKQ
jgi:uncharacterized coiled-coil DUF342 family protein